MLRGLGAWPREETTYCRGQGVEGYFKNQFLDDEVDGSAA
jgi:hypothetical protein